MNLLKQVLYILLLATLSFNGFAQKAPKTIPVIQLRQDYNLFVQSLKETHPGLYRYTSKKQFDSLFKTVSEKLNQPMTKEAFYLLLRPLVADIKCGHTKWGLQDDPDNKFPFRRENLFPLKLYFRDDKAYVLYSYDSTITVPAAAEILSINGKPVKQILQQIRPFITADGNSRTALHEELNQFFNGYLATFVDTSSVCSTEVKEKEKVYTLKLPSVALATIAAVDQQHEPVHQLPLRLSYPQPGTALLTIESFWVDEKVQQFYPFIDSTFKDIKEKGITNLVLDVRNNEGGEEEWGGYLYSYLTDSSFQYYKKLTLKALGPYSFSKYAALPTDALRFAKQHSKIINGEICYTGQQYLYPKPPQTAHFAGNLFVLINGRSYSVTSEFSSVLHHHNGATFIGQETGGAYYGDNSGVFAIVTLPHTQLTLAIPLVGFYTNVSGYPYKDRGVLPHYEVKETVEDVLQKRDIVLEKALQLIEKK